MHSHLVQQGQMQVRERCRFLVPDVPRAFEPAGRAAGDHDREIDVIVNVGIAHAAAVQKQRMVEQRSVAVRRGFQLSRKYANSDTWNALILATFSIFSGLPP